MITVRNGMKEFRRQGFLAGSVSDLRSNGWTGKLWHLVLPVPSQPPSCWPALTGREVEVSLAVRHLSRCRARSGSGLRCLAWGISFDRAMRLDKADEIAQTARVSSWYWGDAHEERTND